MKDAAGETDVGELDPKRWIAFAVVLVAGFMDLLDVTIVNVAVPSIQADLNAEYSQLQWIVSAYVLAFAAVLITGGRLGDIYGRKRLFLVGVGGFSFASLACGLSNSPNALIAAVAVQGAFAGLMVPQILASVRATFPEHERAKAIAIYGGVGGSASAVGLSLGGLLVDVDLFGWGWRSIYFVNVPVGVAALVAAVFVMADSRPERPPRLDIVGMILSITAVLLLVYPLTEGRRLDWPAWTYMMIAASAVTFGIFVLYERRRTRLVGSPLVDLALFGRRSFSVGLTAWFVFWVVFGGFFLMWTLYMQIGLGWSPMRAGLTAACFALGAIAGAGTSANVLVPKFGRHVLTVAALVTAGGFVLYGSMAAHYEAEFASWQMIVPLVITGLGFGMVVAPTIDVLLSRVPADEAGSAAGVLNTGQQLGMALGVALVGIVFFAALDNDSARGVDAVESSTRAELAAQGLPAPAVDGILAQFSQCVTERSAQVDPSAVPESCRPVEGSTPAATQTLADAGATANAVNFAHSFSSTLWYGTGLMILVCVGFLALPRRPESSDGEFLGLDADPDGSEFDDDELGENVRSGNLGRLDPV